MSQKIGFAAEEQAKQYLIAQGLRPVVSNYRSRCGEIDLIMRDGRCLVFIEVRARASTAFGGAVASVTYRKRQKLIKTATWYLLENQLQEKQATRFDVVGLEGKPVKITWIKNAFGIDF
ncbi:YraN family protein [Legionella nagasakiensis]|uniref:YraN family protein n=1 Tax=Legionella nagasakiensis TaxID=535290 RepID=UPI001056D86D|nr:YraN family protein [Legionella nagasakiensis]